MRRALNATEYRKAQRSPGTSRTLLPLRSRTSCNVTRDVLNSAELEQNDQISKRAVPASERLRAWSNTAELTTVGGIPSKRMRRMSGTSTPDGTAAMGDRGARSAKAGVA